MGIDDHPDTRLRTYVWSIVLNPLTNPTFDENWLLPEADHPLAFKVCPHVWNRLYIFELQNLPWSLLPLYITGTPSNAFTPSPSLIEQCSFMFPL
jgi:hypothetical protein